MMQLIEQARNPPAQAMAAEAINQVSLESCRLGHSSQDLRNSSPQQAQTTASQGVLWNSKEIRCDTAPQSCPASGKWNKFQIAFSWSLAGQEILEDAEYISTSSSIRTPLLSQGFTEKGLPI